MATKKKETSLVQWSKELADAAAASVATVAELGGGNFFSIQGGVLKLGGDAIPNNEMVCIILDHVLENDLNLTDFDPDNPSYPECYAFGRSAADMKPHASVTKPASPDCASCPNNVFGSADKGRGKACKNRARLACISGAQLVGGRFELQTDPAAVAGAQVALLKIPPTSIGAWGAYVKAVATSLKRPPWAVYTKIKVVPDPKSQLVVQFELMGSCGPELAEVLVRRSKEQAEATMFEYPANDTTPKAAKSKRPKRQKF